LLEQRGAALAFCPSSNHFLFGRSLSLEQLSRISRLALGSDSPLTAAGDLLDEIRFARQLGASTECLYDIVTGGANRVLRLKCHEGLIAPSGVADFIAVRDHALCPADALATLSYSDVELVVCGGRVRLASDQLKDRCPPQLAQKLELLIIDGVRRWIAAPVSELLCHSREALGPNITMCGRALTQ
jgi:cytosine/adenosine deaminase-related metal-dependent hydrolase